MKYIQRSEEDTNEILGLFDSLIFYTSRKITKKVVEENPILADFEGFTVRKKQVGEHKHDGQDVEYTFTFTSPSNKKTIVKTDMNLVAGWNVCQAYKFKI